jgi:restriction endonuclease S subunit
VSVRSLDEVTYAGLHLYGQGVYRRATIDAGQVKAAALRRIHRGQVVYNRMWATRGSFGVAGSDVEGCLVTNDFPVFDTVDEIEPRYLSLWFGTLEFQSMAASVAMGTTERKRLLERDFLRLEIDLPPLAEQRRIVDLIAAVDAAEASATVLAKEASAALAAYLDGSLLGAGPDARTLGQIADLGSGPSWRAADEATQGGPGFTPVVGITATPAGTRLVDASQRTFVHGLPPSTRTLSAESLVIIRTNGNRARIGNVYRVPVAAHGHAFSAFQIGVFPHFGGDSPYLFWFLSTPTVQRRISDAASGSTGLGNIAVSWLKHLSVPWPSDAERGRIVATADALDEVAASSSGVAARLNALRGALLADLLSGDHEIPASYDRFLDGAA